MGGYTFTDIERTIPHAKRSTMQMWIQRGLIKPLVDASGRGSSRIFSEENKKEIIIASRLLQEYGMSTDGLKRLFSNAGFNLALRNGGEYSDGFISINMDFV